MRQAEDMTGVLLLVETEILPSVINEPASTWNTLDINYEPPRVKRVWKQVGKYRINLHRIYKCEKALYHPHPWPSAIRILYGTYEMGVMGRASFTSTAKPIPTPNWHPNGKEPDHLAKLVLTNGSSYVMEDPWVKHSQLSDGDRDDILEAFKGYYP